MKKLLLSLGLALGIAAAAQAQVEIGLRISPSLGYGRYTDTKDLKFENDGSRPHFSGGLVIDYFFGENYAFSTGLDLAARGANVKMTGSGTINGIVIPAVPIVSKLGLQYLMVPVSLKLFTNEIAPDTRLYAQVGGEIGALLSAKNDGQKTVPFNGEKYSKHINTLDAAAVVALGAELTMGKSTKVFGDISYHHGLVNIADKTYFDKLKAIGFSTADAQVKNNSIALDLGLKF